MAGSVNKVILVGRLGKDPEVRHINDGRPVANLTIATSKAWTDKATGERREQTEWHRVVIWGDGLAGVAQNYLRKGSNVYLEGELQTRKWVDQGGADRFTTEVVLSGPAAQLRLMDRPTDSRSVRPVAQNRAVGHREPDQSDFPGDSAPPVGPDIQGDDWRANSAGSDKPGNGSGRFFDDEIPFAAEWR